MIQKKLTDGTTADENGNVTLKIHYDKYLIIDAALEAYEEQYRALDGAPIMGKAMAKKVSQLIDELDEQVFLKMGGQGND